MSRILIIEDEDNLSNFVSLELQHEGYETKVCEIGREGLDTALNEDWDAILLDLMLPELNGCMPSSSSIKEHADYYDDCARFCHRSSFRVGSRG